MCRLAALFYYKIIIFQSELNIFQYEIRILPLKTDSSSARQMALPRTSCVSIDPSSSCRLFI